MRRIKPFIFIFFVLFYGGLLAGWIIQQRSFDFTGEETNSTVYIQNNRIKTVDSEIVIIDLDEMVLTMLLPAHKVYYCRHPDSLHRHIRETGQQPADSFLKELTPEEIAVFQEYKNRLQESKRIGRQSTTTVDVREIKRKSKVLSYTTRQYQVWVDGRLREKLWISNELPIQKEINLDRFFQFMTLLGSQSVTASYTSTPQYLELRRKGYPLKTIEYSQERKVLTEVKRIQKATIPEEEFYIPDDYQEVELDTFYELHYELEERK